MRHALPFSHGHAPPHCWSVAAAGHAAAPCHSCHYRRPSLPPRSPSPSMPPPPRPPRQSEGGDACAKYPHRALRARTGHQRGRMGGRWTDDDDTHERHTDTNKLTRHTASVAATHPEWAYTSLKATSPLSPPPALQGAKRQTTAQQRSQATGANV